MRTTLALVAVLASVSIAAAQEAGSNKPAPLADVNVATSFVPLTFWEKIKLGGAYFTNPQLVSGAEVAYTYDPKIFATEGRVDLKTLEQKKIVVCGKQGANSKSVEVIPCPPQTSGSSGSEVGPARGEVKVISSEPKLLGNKAEDVVKKVD